MGVVTARGRRASTRSSSARPGAHPVDPRRLRAVRRRRGLRGWAARTRSPRWPTAPRRSPRVDVIAGPGNLYVQEAKRQVSGDVGIDGFAGPERRAGRSPPAAPTPALVALDLLAQAEHGDGHDRRAASPTTRALLDAVAAPAGRARRDATPPRRVVAVADARRRRSRSPRRSRPSTSSWSAPAPRRWRRACAAPGCVFVGRERRRPRSATTSRAPTTRCPPAAPRASPPGCRRAHFRRRMSEVHIGAAAGGAGARRRADRPRRGLRRATRRRWRRASGESAASMTPHRRDRPQDQGDRRPPDAGARRHGRGHARDRRRLPRPHARPARPPRAPGPRRRRSPATCETGAHHTVEDTGHRARPGARPGARRPRRDLPLRPRRRADGRGARERARSTSPAGRCCAFEADAAARRAPAASTTSWPRSSSAPSPTTREADAARHASRRAPTPTT